MNSQEEENIDDIQIEPIESEIKDSESSAGEFEIATYPADYTLEVLHKMMKENDIVHPKFQRGFVWKIEQSSRLIESFMLGLPVPQIFFYTDPEQKSIIVDGQQRLKSIYYFFEGYFGEVDKSGNRKVFKLEGIDEDNRWHNKTFGELSDSDKRKFKNSILRAIIVKQLNPADDTSIYHIFERLNTGGTLLKNQEIRNCVYWGKLNDLLLELNKYHSWRLILGKEVFDSRQKDVELILRYMALLHWGESYKKPMKDFLSRFMKKNRNPSDNFIRSERARFKKTCDLVISKLGNKPFNLRGPLNTSVFDSVFIAFSKHLDTCPSNIRERYEKLKYDVEFDSVTRNSTTDDIIVRKRLELVEKVLFEE